MLKVSDIWEDNIKMNIKLGVPVWSGYDYRRVPSVAALLNIVISIWIP
jgi:hypothetical protein